jgi:hypothetical protein
VIAYETITQIGSEGALKLEHLPFPEGEAVKVRIEPSAERGPQRKPFVFGLHAGLVETSEDFDAPLPDSFWLGGDETAA